MEYIGKLSLLKQGNAQLLSIYLKLEDVAFL